MVTINLRKAILKVPRYKRAKKAVTAVRDYLQQHMKASEEKIKIGKYLNLKIWEHGIKNPLTRVTVLAKKDDKGIVTAELPSVPAKKQKPQKTKQAANLAVTTTAPATPAAPATETTAAAKSEK